VGRQVGDAKLQTREARRRLAVGSQPHWRSLERGRSIGYRKNSGSGAWIARLYVGNGKYLERRLGSADDTVDSDGHEVLTWAEAQKMAHEWFARTVNEDSVQTASDRMTVSQSLDAYLEWYRGHRKAFDDAKLSIEANIRPVLGATEIRRLTRTRIEAWHRNLAATPARLRTAHGDVQKFAGQAESPEATRKRKVTANRNLSILKAALNRTREEFRLSIAPVWTRAKAFRNVTMPRQRFLQQEEACRLTHACDPAFRLLVQAALLTGARYGELARLRVADYRHGKLFVQDSKSDKSRWISLTREGADFFGQLCAGRNSDELMLLKPARFENSAGERVSGWGRTHQQGPMRVACERAGIAPLGFHQLRHTYSSLSLMAGMPLLVLARNLGHADTRMVEHHYGHLLRTYEDQMIEAHAPKFGFTCNSNVIHLSKRLDAPQSRADHFVGGLTIDWDGDDSANEPPRAERGDHR